MKFLKSKEKEPCQFCGAEDFDVIKENGYCDKCPKSKENESHG